jgi:hypothetical protein
MNRHLSLIAPVNAGFMFNGEEKNWAKLGSCEYPFSATTNNISIANNLRIMIN